MSTDKVTVSRGRTPGRAVCESCADLPSDVTRERVRLHVKNHGHVAHFVIEDIATYYPPENR